MYNSFEVALQQRRAAVASARNMRAQGSEHEELGDGDRVRVGDTQRLATVHENDRDAGMLVVEYDSGVEEEVTYGAVEVL